MAFHSSEKGQALVEYILILVFVVSIGYAFVGQFSEFVSEVFGGFIHYVNITLTNGSCQEQCFFPAYANGPLQQ